MELKMPGWILATCAALAIIPTTNRDRAVKARALRGDAPSIANVKIAAEELAAARKALAGRERIAVLPFEAPAGNAEMQAFARGVTSALTSDLHYVPGLIVLEEAEGANKIGVPAELGAAAKTLGARYVVFGWVTRKGSDLTLKASLFDAASGLTLTDASEAGTDANLFAVADRALLALLPKECTPDAHATKQITKLPTTNQRARALYDEAAAIAERMGGVTERDDLELASEALDLVESSLKLDSKYLQAALLHAGCLARLGKTDLLKKSLTKAHNTRVPPDRFDELTLLELEGDYYVFAKADPKSAIRQYTKMLEIDPNHLRALWMLTALYAGDFEQAKGPGIDLKEAGKFAARLVAAHPDSAAAKFLTEKKP
jgi:TolB-like protein